MSKIPHHYLQQLLLPSAAMGAKENLPEPHAEPPGIRCPGNMSLRMPDVIMNDGKQY